MRIDDGGDAGGAAERAEQCGERGAVEVVRGGHGAREGDKKAPKWRRRIEGGSETAGGGKSTKCPSAGPKHARWSDAVVRRHRCCAAGLCRGRMRMPGWLAVVAAGRWLRDAACEMLVGGLLGVSCSSGPDGWARRPDSMLGSTLGSALDSAGTVRFSLRPLAGPRPARSVPGHHSALFRPCAPPGQP